MSENKYLHVLMISASSAHRKRARQKFQELNLSDGLIRKEQSYVSGGKRAYNIYFTEKGLELAHKVNSITAEIEEAAFEGFTPDERNTFLELFSRINDNLEIK